MTTELQSSDPDPRPPGSIDEELARAQVRAEELDFELQLCRQTVARLERELRAMDVRLAKASAERAAAQQRADETSRYIEVLHRSLPWRALRVVRRLIGRTW